MTETLLSPSNVLLFGRIVEDLRIIVPKKTPPAGLRRIKAKAVAGNQTTLSAAPIIDGYQTVAGDPVLLTGQTDDKENGVYIVAAGAWNRAPQLNNNRKIQRGLIVDIEKGTTKAGSVWVLFPDPDFDMTSDPIIFEEFAGDAEHSPFSLPRTGANKDLQDQVARNNPFIARIYGFSYSGTYYELPDPVYFLVHGEGASVTEARTSQLGIVRRARAPGDPSRTGLAAADFQFAEDVKVWSYDKADYTIRMDVESGMFEDVLLDPFFSGDGGGGVSGARVSGARVSGARISGARISGARVSGARLSGGRGDASD